MHSNGAKYTVCMRKSRLIHGRRSSNMPEHAVLLASMTGIGVSASHLKFSRSPCSWRSQTCSKLQLESKKHAMAFLDVGRTELHSLYTEARKNTIGSICLGTQGQICSWWVNESSNVCYLDQNMNHGVLMPDLSAFHCSPACFCAAIDSCIRRLRFCIHGFGWESQMDHSIPSLQKIAI